jgi:uncharacterized delta-60 repeat protein
VLRKRDNFRRAFKGFDPTKVARSEDGSFTFETLLKNGEPYHVAVWQQPTDPDQECYVENGEGTMNGDVTDVQVECAPPHRYWAFDDETTFYDDAEAPLRADIKLRGVLDETYLFPSRGPSYLGSVIGQHASEERYNVDGSRDTTFGDAGRVITPIMEVGRAAALQPDGRLVVAGRRAGNFAIARFEANGVSDAGFGADGVIDIDFFGGADDPAALAIQPDGRIVVAGEAQDGTQYVLALARLVP